MHGFLTARPAASSHCQFQPEPSERYTALPLKCHASWTLLAQKPMGHHIVSENLNPPQTLPHLASSFKHSSRSPDPNPGWPFEMMSACKFKHNAENYGNHI